MSKRSKSTAILVAIYAGAICAGFGGAIGLGIWIFILCVILALACRRSPSRGAGRVVVGGEARSPAQAQSVWAGQRCPLCHAGFELGEDAESCVECETVFHSGCREEWRVCSTLGCRSKPRTNENRGQPFRVAGVSSPPRRTLGSRPRIRLRPHPSHGLLVSVREEEPPLDFGDLSADANLPPLTPWPAPGVSGGVAKLRLMADGRSLLVGGEA